MRVHRGETVRRVREMHRLDRRAELAGEVQRLSERLQHARLDSLRRTAPPARRRADALQIGPRGQLDRVREADAGAVARDAPTMPLSSSAVSVTSRVNRPAWSSEEAKAIIP